MLFRAIFWIGLVSVLMPREPDLGLGRPEAGAGLSAALISAAQEGLSGDGAEASGSDEPSFGVGEGLQALAMRSLAQIRADLEESKALRSGI